MKTVKFMGKRLHRCPHNEDNYVGRVGPLRISLWDEGQEGWSVFLRTTKPPYVETALVYAKTLPTLERRAFKVMAKECNRMCDIWDVTASKMNALGRRLGAIK